MTEGEFYLALMLLGFECNGKNYLLPSEHIELDQYTFRTGRSIRRISVRGDYVAGSLCINNDFNNLYNQILEILGIKHERVEGTDKSTNDLRLV